MHMGIASVCALQEIITNVFMNAMEHGEDFSRQAQSAQGVGNNSKFIRFFKNRINFGEVVVPATPSASPSASRTPSPSAIARADDSGDSDLTEPVIVRPFVPATPSYRDVLNADNADNVGLVPDATTDTSNPPTVFLNSGGETQRRAGPSRLPRRPRRTTTQPITIAEGRVPCPIPGCGSPSGQLRLGFTPRGLRRHMSEIHPSDVTGSPPPRSGFTARRALHLESRPRRFARANVVSLGAGLSDKAWLDNHAQTSEAWAWLSQSLGRCRTNLGRLSRLFSTAVSSIAVTCDDTDVGSWWALMALPRLCLPSKNPTAMQERPEAYNIKGLLSSFIRGDFRSLWDLAIWRDSQALHLNSRASGLVRMEPSPYPEQTIGAPQMHLANRMMRSGRPYKALKALTGGGPVTISNGVVQRLNDLHPTSGAISEAEAAELDQGASVLLRDLDLILD